MSRFISEYVMVRPTYFDVSYKINPYMGGEVNVETAISQWESVRDSIQQSGGTVHTVDPRNLEGDAVTKLPDIVFAANHGAFLSTGEFLVAHMRNTERSGETKYVKEYMRDLFPEVDLMDSSVPFEGWGDFYDDEFTEYWWAGHGVRSDASYITQLSDHFVDQEIVPLELDSEWFYHLDTCMFVLDDESVLIESKAFTDESYERIASEFENVYEWDSTDSETFIPCNSIHLPSGKILTDTSNKEVFEDLLGYGSSEVVYRDVSEFEKAGGSIRCMLLPVVE